MPKLTEKQKRFVNEYLVDLNATQAAIRAGYSEKSASRQAVELLNKTHVAKAVQKAMSKREERTQVTQDMVVNQLAKFAFSDIRDLMTWNNETGRIHLREVDEIDGTLITELSQTVTEVPYGDEMTDKITTKVKKGDPLKALQMLGQHMGMFDPKMNVSIDKTKAETELIKERTKLLKGAKKDTSLLEALIQTVNGDD